MAGFTKDNWPASPNGLPCRPGASSAQGYIQDARGYIPDTPEMWAVYAEVVEAGLLYYLRRDTREWGITATNDQTKSYSPDAVSVDVLLVFNYPQANEPAQKIQEANAQKIIGKASIACPRNPNGNWPAVEMVDLRK